MVVKSKIRYGHIFLRCSEPEHKRCSVLRDAVMERFSNIVSAYTTITNIDTDYCVGASAIIKNGEINSFREQLQSFKSKTRKIKVSKARLYVTQA